MHQELQPFFSAILQNVGNVTSTVNIYIYIYYQVLSLSNSFKFRSRESLKDQLRDEVNQSYTNLFLAQL